MQSKKVFVASDILFIFIDRAHPKHIQSAAFFRYFAQQRYQLFTSVVSVNQVYQQIYDKISPSLAKDFIKALALSSINVIYPEEADFKTTTKTLSTYNSNELNFEEALMTVLCHKKNIPQICTFNYFHRIFGLTPFYLPI
jgi:predicted nucleic acid-binding protein